MNVIIKPKKLNGEVIIPPSKSLSHRAIIAASLASGKSEISNILFSKENLSVLFQKYIVLRQNVFQGFNIHIPYRYIVLY